MNTFSRMTYYDSLNKLVTGILVLLLLIPMSVCTSFWTNPLFYITAFIIGIVYQSIIQCLTKCLRNNNYLIKKASDKNKERNEKKGMKVEVADYYYAYYYVTKNHSLLNIPVLEALENFLRNLFFIGIFYLIALLSNCHKVSFMLSFLGDRCTIAMGLSFLLIAVILIWIKVQFTIHYSVIESYCYLKKIQEDEKKS